MDLWLLLCKQQLHNRITCSITSNLIYSFIGVYGIVCKLRSLETVDWRLYKFGGEGDNY